MVATTISTCNWAPCTHAENGAGLIYNFFSRCTCSKHSTIIIKVKKKIFRTSNRNIETSNIKDNRRRAKVNQFSPLLHSGILKPCKRHHDKNSEGNPQNKPRQERHFLQTKTKKRKGKRSSSAKHDVRRIPKTK
jgi:hypothetical protein